MNKNKAVIYFLTEDINNVKEQNEIEFLRELGRVVLVTATRQSEVPGVKQLIVAKPAATVARLRIIWSKACYVLARLAESRTDFEFPSRNIYTGNAAFRQFINVLWGLKTKTWFNRILPSYDRLYFFPFVLGNALMRLFSRKRRVPRSSRFSRLVIHDSLVLRLVNFAPFIASARNESIRSLANVKSWDNPFYSQFCATADGYALWSDNMWADISRGHGIPKRYLLKWGARPFYAYWSSARSAVPVVPARSDSITVPLRIGYAAAFCDTIMGRCEIEVIKKVAAVMQRHRPQDVLLFRPYPIIPAAFYEELLKFPNVKIIDIGGKQVDRYGDGRELIKFGSDVERLDYLSRCDCFLSIATSFTIEAAIFGLPIVHLALSSTECETAEEREFFKRIEISDHLEKYYKHSFALVDGYDKLAEKIEDSIANENESAMRNRHFLNNIGIPALDQEWPTPDSEFANSLWQFAGVGQ